MTEIKPAAFKNGVPAEQANGFYGIEDELIDLAAGEQIVAVVTFVVDEVMEKRNAGETWPVIKITHIEPLHEPDAVAAALKLRDAQYKKRTSQDALDLGDEGEA
jgi:hypothetical protein